MNERTNEKIYNIKAKRIIWMNENQTGNTNGLRRWIKYFFICIAAAKRTFDRLVMFLVVLLTLFIHFFKCCCFRYSSFFSLHFALAFCWKFNRFFSLIVCCLQCFFFLLFCSFASVVWCVVMCYIFFLSCIGRYHTNYWNGNQTQAAAAATIDETQKKKTNSVKCNATTKTHNIEQKKRDEGKKSTANEEIHAKKSLA